MAISEQAQVALGVGCGSTGVGVEIAKALNMTKDTGNIGAANVATVSATEYTDASGTFHKTVLTLTATPIAVVNGTEYQGVKVYDFPEGAISILGAIASLSPITTSTIASTLNANSTLAISLGTAVASNVTLSSTMANVIASFAGTSSGTINVAHASAPFKSALTVPCGIDGTGTAADLYLNFSVPTTTDVDADATTTWTGTITIFWAYIGDA